MSDRGPYSLEESIQATLDKFLGDENASSLRPVDGQLVVLDPSNGYGGNRGAKPNWPVFCRLLSFETFCYQDLR
jgi:hypothetical protein